MQAGNVSVLLIALHVNSLCCVSCTMLNLAVKFMNKRTIICEYLARIGSQGGKKRAAMYDQATLRKWAKKGGRPRKKRRSR
jgi:hypothetical protein